MRILQALLFALTLLLLPTTAHTPMRQLPQPQQANKPVIAQKQPTYTTFEVTAYTANDKNMNGRGVTASRARAIPWVTVAATHKYPMGTKIYFPELKKTVIVMDRFASLENERELKIKPNRLDLYSGKKNRAEALQFGRRKLEGVVLK